MRRRGVALIAALEVVGGFAGLAIASQLAFKSLSVPAGAALFGMLGIPMLLSLRAGQLLWKGKASGRALSIFVQACQVPIVQVAAFHYEFFVGARVGLLWKGADLFTPLNLGAGASIQFAGDALPTTTGVNLLALWALWYLWRASPDQTLAPGRAEEIARAAD
jgi:hypothetical protein